MDDIGLFEEEYRDVHIYLKRNTKSAYGYSFIKGSRLKHATKIRV
jgi:hypothetical protein